MSLFDGKGLNPRPTNRREMINQMSDSVRTNFLDPMMGSLGMESEETTIMNIMKGANLSDPKSVADTFSKIMAINPIKTINNSSLYQKIIIFFVKNKPSFFFYRPLYIFFLGNFLSLIQNFFRKIKKMRP